MAGLFEVISKHEVVEVSPRGNECCSVAVCFGRALTVDGTEYAISGLVPPDLTLCFTF
jgi:hypothetical protein